MPSDSEICLKHGNSCGEDEHTKRREEDARVLSQPNGRTVLLFFDMGKIVI